MYEDRSDSWATIILAIILMAVVFGISSCVNDASKRETESCLAKGGQWIQASRDYFYCVMPK